MGPHVEIILLLLNLGGLVYGAGKFAKSVDVLQAALRELKVELAKTTQELRVAVVELRIALTDLHARVKFLEEERR